MCFRLPACLLPVLGLLAMAGPASAVIPDKRTADDPCQGDPSAGVHSVPEAFLVCSAIYRFHRAKFPFAPSQGDAPPKTAEEPSCPPGTAVGDAPWERNIRALTYGRWGFWSQDGQWITWTGSGTTETAQIDGRDAAVRMHPTLNNWWPFDEWRVRVFIYCQQPPPAALRLVSRDDPQPLTPANDDTAPAVVDDGSPRADDLDEDIRDDFVRAGRGDDRVKGAGGDDELLGGPGEDRLSGGAGDDEVLGGAGDDHLTGGPGSDSLFDRTGDDVIAGGPGNDRVSTLDRHRDVIDCGPGNDVVAGDEIDVTVNCEHVFSDPRKAPHRPPAP